MHVTRPQPIPQALWSQDDPEKKQDGKTPVSPQGPVVGCRLPPGKVCNLGPGSPRPLGKVSSSRHLDRWENEGCQPTRGLHAPGRLQQNLPGASQLTSPQLGC